MMFGCNFSGFGLAISASGDYLCVASYSACVGCLNYSTYFSN